MKKWMIFSFFVLLISGLSVQVLSQPQNKNLKKLHPMPDLPFLSLQEINRSLKHQCQNPGRTDFKNIKTEDHDCVAGEIIAIFNPTAAQYPSDNTKTDLVNLKRLTLDRFLQSIKGTQEIPQPFLETQLYALPQAASLTSSTSQVCGQILLRIKLAPGVDVNQAAEDLKKAVTDAGLAGIQYIQPTSLYAPQPIGSGAPHEDPTLEAPPIGLPVNWAYSAINAKARNVSNVRVAVLDTGVTSKSNIRLASGLNVSDLDAITNSPLDDFIGNSEITTGKDGHGTGIASIIANRSKNPFRFQGIARDATIIPVKVCKNLECEEVSVIYGTCYAASAGVEASVLNMSFGTLIDGEILHGAIQDVTRAGSLVVAAAGNTRSQRFAKKHAGIRNNDVYPARFSSGYSGKLNATNSGVLLSVGAVTTQLNYAEFATVNSSVDLAAPGSWVTLIGKSGKLHPSKPLVMNQNYAGTSFAAAYVSAAAAVLIAQNSSSMTPLDVAHQLVLAAKPWNTIPAFACVTADECGQGFLQIP